MNRCRRKRRLLVFSRSSILAGHRPIPPRRDEKFDGALVLLAALDEQLLLLPLRSRTPRAESPCTARCAITAAIRKTSSSANPDSCPCLIRAFRLRINWAAPPSTAAIAAASIPYPPSAPSSPRCAPPGSASSPSRPRAATEISSPSRKNAALLSIIARRRKAVVLESDGRRRRQAAAFATSGLPATNRLGNDLRLRPLQRRLYRRWPNWNRLRLPPAGSTPCTFASRSSRRMGSMVMGSMRSSGRFECSTG